MKYIESKLLWKYENMKYGNVSLNFNRINRFTSLHHFLGLQKIFHIYIYIYIYLCVCVEVQTRTPPLYENVRTPLSYVIVHMRGLVDV